MSEPIKLEYTGKIYYFCCSGCEMLFKKEPARYIQKDLMCLPCSDYDAKREIYFIYDEVKYYFCSRSCAEKFRKVPEKYLNGK
ncbi:MAG: YHS domain-containing protein [Ignavibacteria bacterium]|nr:YHS domain-containing protein [Ignavibacteria bacterium]